MIKLPTKNRLIIYYGYLIENPKNIMDKISDFLIILDSKSLINNTLNVVRKEPNEKWKSEIKDSLLKSIKPIIMPTMNKL